MWTDPDNRHSRWLDKINRRHDRGVHNLNCCVGSGNYIANALPALQVQTRPKCNVNNSSLGKVLSFIKRAFSCELEHQSALTLHNLNYDHHQYNHLQQQYVDACWNESFESPVTRKSASVPLKSLQENIRQIFWGLTNSVRTSPFNQIMLQQRHYAMTTSFESINKCEQLPTMSAISRSMEAAKQTSNIKETTTNLLSNAMSTIISSTTDFLEDLMACLPSSTGELFKTEIKQPATVSQSKEKKMSPPPARCDEIACIEFFARPTYCYFVIDICAHDLDSVDMWHSGSHVSTAPIMCSNKKGTFSSSTCNGDNDANNNSCQLDSSTFSFKDGTSPLISDCSPDVNSDRNFWAERSGKRRERNISECSDDFICFMDENDEEDEIDTDEEDGDEDDDEDDDNDDLEDEDDNVDEVDNVPCHRDGKSHVEFLRCFQNIQPIANNTNNKNNSLAQRPRDKHNADNGDDAIMPVALFSSSCCGNNKHHTKDKFEPQRECSTAKRVRFDPKTTIHTMHAWDYAYRTARKGHWEDYARDRARFQQRIQRTAAYLNPILSPQHRSKVYNSRFTNTLNA